MLLRSRRAKCWRRALLPLWRAEVQRQHSYVFLNAKPRQSTSQMDTDRGEENTLQEGESDSITWQEQSHGRETLSQMNAHWPAFSIHRSSSRSHTKLHIHRSWRIPTKISKDEWMEQTQVTELSITSWNRDILSHRKLERFLTYFDADIIIFQGTRLRIRTIPRDGKAKDDTITPIRSEWRSRGNKNFSWGWNNEEFSIHACGVLIAIREATVGAGQIVQRYDPPRSMTGRFGGIRVKNWQTHGDPTILAGYAPQENGPSQHKEHFCDQVTKTMETMAKLPRRTSIIFGGDFNGDPLSDDAAIGWQHPCENLTENGAHIGEICKAAHHWSPSTWAARPVSSNPCWEGNTWRGRFGEQSRPDHIPLSVDLASPPVTVDYLSSRNLRGTALAPIDHASLRITLRYRFRAVGRRGGRRCFDRARLAAATTDLHFAKQSIDEVRRWAQTNLNKLEQLDQEAHPDPSWQYMENSILEMAMTAFQAGDTPKRKPWLSENTMDLIIKREEVVKAAASWVQPAPLGALCLYINNWDKQWHYTDARTSLHVSWPGLCCVPSQIKSDVVAIKTNKRTLPNLQKTWIRRKSSTTTRRCGSELATSRARLWAREVGSLFLQMRVSWHRQTGTTTWAIPLRHKKSIPRSTVDKDKIDRFETCSAPTTQLQGSPSGHAAAWNMEKLGQILPRLSEDNGQNDSCCN